MSARFDMVVIGAGVGGLAAAALAAKGGARVTLVEAKAAPPEPAGALFALDPEMIARLKLARHGLRFCARDLPLTVWDEDGPGFTLVRDRRATARALGDISDADARAWEPFQAQLRARARALRAWWWRAHAEGQARDVLWTRGARAAFARECVTGAEDFLRRHLESPRLRAALLFDAVAGGLAPSEPGSAVALLWRAAQEMAGLQGASALAAPGSGVIAALLSAAHAARVRLRLGARVAAIRARDGAVSAVVLESGEEIAARAVICGLSRAATMRLAGWDTAGWDTAWDGAGGGVGDARIVFTLAPGVVLPAGRVILAPPPESYADAHEAARAGMLHPALPLECVADAGRLVVTARLAPVAPPQGWGALQAPLAAAAAKRLSRHMPGFAAALRGVVVTPPAPVPRAGLAHLLAPAAARAATNLAGLYLCGPDAEPLPAISGRAGRFAAKFAAPPLSGFRF